MEGRTKFCKYCGEIIDWDCVICVKCGKQVEELKYSQDSPIIINNTVTTSASSANTNTNNNENENTNNNVSNNSTTMTNNNVNNNTNNNINNNNNTDIVSEYADSYIPISRPKNKWISLFLCLFTVCGHKFYEGKIFIGILYFFTSGLFGIGWIIDLIVLLGKPTIYYVE